LFKKTSGVPVHENITHVGSIVLEIRTFAS